MDALQVRLIFVNVWSLFLPAMIPYRADPSALRSREPETENPTRLQLVALIYTSRRVSTTPYYGNLWRRNISVSDVVLRFYVVGNQCRLLLLRNREERNILDNTLHKILRTTITRLNGYELIFHTTGKWTCSETANIAWFLRQVAIQKTWIETLLIASMHPDLSVGH